MNYLLKVTEEWRVPNEQAADELEKQFRSEDHLYKVIECKKTEKVVKAKGEIVDQYIHVKSVKVFNDPKEPTYDIGISYSNNSGF